jgi:hypothetical protein
MITLTERDRVAIHFKSCEDIITNMAEATDHGNMRSRKEREAAATRLFGNMVGARTPMESFEKLRRNVVVADSK